MQSLRWIILTATAVFLWAGCSNVQLPFKELPPYESYLKSLDQASLSETALGRSWIASGKKALQDSIHIPLPFNETGYFTENEPAARSYGFQVRAGEILTIKGELKADGRVFMDLFAWNKDTWEKIAYNDSALSLTREFKENTTCLLRLQPELLVNAYYAVGIDLTPALINPVSGASNKSIGSVYGDPRDGGKRSHEGVDIFASRGTPVLAPTSGTIRRVGTNHLGGKVVWMHDADRGHSYYFAHLDSQLVQPGQRLRQGDTLGLVGNTGNARTTPPHLHFGIYQNGSKDPLSYIRVLQTALPAEVDTSFAPMEYRVTAPRLNLRAGPATTEIITESLTHDTYVRVLAKSNQWARISLPNRKEGYVATTYLEKLESGTPVSLDRAVDLLTSPEEQAVPVTILPASTMLKKLAHFGEFSRVRTDNGLEGWIKYHSPG